MGLWPVHLLANIHTISKQGEEKGPLNPHIYTHSQTYNHMLDTTNHTTYLHLHTHTYTHTGPDEPLCCAAPPVLPWCPQVVYFLSPEHTRGGDFLRRPANIHTHRHRHTRPQHTHILPWQTTAAIRPSSSHSPPKTPPSVAIITAAWKREEPVTHIHTRTPYTPLPPP